MRGVPLLALGLAASAAAGAPSEFGFTQGLGPLRVGEGAPPPERCGACHPAELRDWQGSRHRVSWTNEVFQAGYVIERLPFCVSCHAPHPDQAAEVRANLAWYQAADPRQRGRPAPDKRPEPQAGLGIHCATCHWRDGEVLSAKPDSGLSPHPVRVVPALSDPSFCKGCHEFSMPAVKDGVFTVTDVPMQSTWSEWVAYREGGGDETCQGCHMPGGRHLFRGAHDLDLLRGSVQVDAALEGDGVRFTLRSVGVGHHLPTGDLFRNLTLEVEQRGDFVTIDRIGRRFERLTLPDGGVRKQVVDDTSLRPGEPRQVVLPAVEGARWRLRYHYGSEEDERLGLVPLDRMIVTLHEGRVLPLP